MLASMKINYRLICKLVGTYGSVHSPRKIKSDFKTSPNLHIHLYQAKVTGAWFLSLWFALLLFFFFFSYRFATYFLCFQGELEKACADLQTNLAKELERTTSKAEIIRQSKENLAQLQVSI